MKKETVSTIIDRLADKHDINVTVARDFVEDLRRIAFEKTSGGIGSCGIDIYAPLRGIKPGDPLWRTALPKYAIKPKPVKVARKAAK